VNIGVPCDKWPLLLGQQKSQESRRKGTCYLTPNKLKQPNCLIFVVVFFISILSFNIAGWKQSWREREKFWDRWGGHLGSWPESLTIFIPTLCMWHLITEAVNILLSDRMCVFHMSQNMDSLKKWWEVQIEGEKTEITQDKQVGWRPAVLHPSWGQRVPSWELSGTLFSFTQHFLSWMESVCVGGLSSLLSWMGLEPSLSWDPLKMGLALNRNSEPWKHRRAGNSCGWDLNHT
jgi:hypothetical protein